MDLSKVLQQLHEELDNLNAAIATLERLQAGQKRRGRPPVIPEDIEKVAAPSNRPSKAKTPRQGRG